MQPCPSGERQVRKRQEKSTAGAGTAEPREPSIFLDAREGAALSNAETQVRRRPAVKI
ncbi:MAG: hypothetical protein KJ017_01305 [Alphaproteobacteria bacterium]|nr:hypothetical protein [Alphaproteobacteria bacterium]